MEGANTNVNGQYEYEASSGRWVRTDESMVIRQGNGGWNFCPATSGVVTDICLGSSGRAGYVSDNGGWPAESAVYDWFTTAGSTISFPSATYVCTGRASGGSGVHQANDHDCTADTPETATLVHMFAKPLDDANTCYFDCVKCVVPPPPPSVLSCATSVSTLGTKTSLGACNGGSGLDAGCNHPNGNNYQPHEWVGGVYFISDTQVHTSNAPLVGQIYMCSAMSSGGWGVGQAACCRPDAQTPLLATRASQFGPTGGYRTYYDCSVCPPLSSTPLPWLPPPPRPSPSLPPPPLSQLATPSLLLPSPPPSPSPSPPPPSPSPPLSFSLSVTVQLPQDESVEAKQVAASLTALSEEKELEVSK